MGCSCHVNPPCRYCVEGEDTNQICPDCNTEGLRINAWALWCDECDWNEDL